jgi:DNA repair protein RecO (recombination protein O)
MSSLVRTEAIVLRTINYRETSKIVTFYTREFGKIKAIAKGARQAKSKFGASLEPMAHVALVLYKKDHRDLHLVSQCDTLTSFRYLYDDIDKMTVGMLMVELVDRVSHDEESRGILFPLLQETLVALNAATKHYRNLLYRFEIALSSTLGFHPSFQNCTVCGRSIVRQTGTARVFHIAKGGPLCSLHTRVDGLKVKTHASILDLLAKLSAGQDLSEVFRVDVPMNLRGEIENLLLGYLHYHFEGLHHLKSAKVLKQLERQ